MFCVWLMILFINPPVQEISIIWSFTNINIMKVWKNCNYSIAKHRKETKKGLFFTVKNVIYLYLLRTLLKHIFLKVKVSFSVVSDSLRSRDCSPPSFFVHGILQIRILEWIDISFFRGSFQHRDLTLVGLLHCRQILMKCEIQKKQKKVLKMKGEKT